jgi:hypothetical protein
MEFISNSVSTEITNSFMFRHPVPSSCFNGKFYIVTSEFSYHHPIMNSVSLDIFLYQIPFYILNKINPGKNCSSARKPFLYKLIVQLRRYQLFQNISFHGYLIIPYKTQVSIIKNLFNIRNPFKM